MNSNDISFVNVPFITLRGLVVFPGMSLHFDVGRKKSIRALKEAMNKDQKIFLVAQKDASDDNPDYDGVYDFGVVCEIKQMLRIPNSQNLRVVVEGLKRAEIISYYDEAFVHGVVSVVEAQSSKGNPKANAYAEILRAEFEKYSSVIPKISVEVFSKMLSIEDLGELADYACYNSFLKYVDKQRILEEVNPEKRAHLAIKLLKSENLNLNYEAEIQEKLQKELDKHQREYYLREELKVITDELGDSENPVEEADAYKSRIASLDCKQEIKEKLFKECDKLMKMPVGSHEATVVRNYIDKCLELPFGRYTKNSISLERARRVLDKDHYGLDKVKTRIVESLAVYKRNPDYSGQIICLYGPPGVGKTSVVKSLAKSMNRKYVRVALGGVHDEAEIRGHRRTYIGAMPGRIVDAIIKSGVMNPIILLDEIDKLGNDYKGDPSSALLEALDPEQNKNFADHYIDFPIDLSKVLFITTANDTSTISAPLFDRMEVIELNSYTIDEKFNIAKKHLIKKALAKHSLSARELKISDEAIYKIIECYTREAGVRLLEKQISKLCRKATVELEEGSRAVKINADNLKDYLGIERYDKVVVSSENLVGTVNGLAWTSVGGALLPIEISAFDGTGRLEITGNLGDVMKESAKTAVSYIRSRAEVFGIENDFYKTKDIHIHAPEGAVPKDGPSAGLAITTALLSELTGTPVKSNVAMTGEISLKGRAMQIGGLKEKSMAGYKAGCDTIIIPKDNLKDLSEISDEVKASVNFVTVSDFEEIIPIALEYFPGKAKGSAIINKDNNSKSASVTQ